MAFYARRFFWGSPYLSEFTGGFLLFHLPSPETPSLLTNGLLFLLFCTGFLSGFVDSIAGGGGLISVPVLMTTGMPAQMVLGTNKLQSSFGALSSAYNYTRNGVVDLKACIPGVIFTIIGASGGAIAVQLMNPDLIRHLVPFLLIPVFVYTLFSGSLDSGGKAKLPGLLFFFLAGTLIGFYDGFFGPGTGSFWAAGLVFFMGMEMTHATGTTKVMNFTSNIVALSLFVVGGNVNWHAGLVMAVGCVIGARAGSGMAVKRGSRFIRPVFVTIVLITIARLFYQNYSVLFRR